MNARKLLISGLMLVSVLFSACTSATATPGTTAIPPTAAPTVASAQAANPQLIEYNIPTSASEPGGIVAGPDGALWFVETAVNTIGRISTDGVFTEYPVLTPNAIDTDQGFLAVGPDGALWFNEDLVNKIGRITTAGQITEFALPDEFKPTREQDSPIRAIVAGPDGALWVTSSAANAIVKLTMDGKVAAKYVLPKAGSGPVGMVVGPDGALWFVEKTANQIGRITLDGKLSEYALPDNSSSALRITVGIDKAIWFTMHDANKIGRISMDGAITTFDAANMGPVGITSGADGAIWFTGYGSTEIGRMTTDGVLTKIQVPTTASVPYQIVAGADGNLWFTEQQGNKIGQIQLSAPTAAQPLTTFSPTTFNLPLTFRYGSGWEVVEEYSDVVSLADKNYDGYFAFINPKSIKIAGPATPFSAIPFPDDFGTWIQTHDLFQVVKTQPVVVGGFNGTQIDADATSACGTKKSWLFLAGTGWNCADGGHIHFIYLDDVNGERLLIMTEGVLSAQDFMSRVEASQKVLDTVVFAKPQTTFSSKTFKLPISFSFGPQWYVEEEYSDVVTLFGKPDLVDLAFMTAKDIKIDSAAAPFEVIPFPEDFVTWIQSHSLFHVVGTQPVSVNGFQGTQIDAIATAACGNKKNWIFLSDTGWHCTDGEYFRFIYLDDVYGERVLIMNTGSVKNSKAGVAESQKVLDTVVFSKP